MAKGPSPVAPLTPPTGPSYGDAPGRLTARHTPPNSAPPPAYHPPPLPDKVAHKSPKRPRPSSPAAHTKARKHARQPPRPVRPLSLKRSTTTRSPPPKRPLTIRDMFNPPPPSTSNPLAASAPVSAPSPGITRYFAPVPPPPRAQTHNRPHLHPTCHLFEKATLTRFSHASPRQY